MRQLPIAAALVLTLAACATTPGARPRSVAQAAPIALEAICSISPAERSADSLRADAAEHGFQYWGDFFEFQGRGGSVDVRPGPTGLEPCSLEFMLDFDQAEAVDAALRRWADRQGLQPGMEGPVDGLTARRRDGPGGLLSWTVTPSAVADEPSLIDVHWDPAG
jgi:hypothetical protein